MPSRQRRPPDPRPDGPPGPQAAHEACLRWLALRPRTRVELARRLQQRGVPDEVAEPVLTRLTEVGLIDDAAFATAWVSSRSSNRGLAGAALARELRQRGVDHETVDEAVSVLDPQTQSANARALAVKRQPSLRALPVQTQVRRLAAMLARKGYPGGLALQIARETVRAADGNERDHDGEGVGT